MHRAIAAATWAQGKPKWKCRAEAGLTETRKCPSELAEFGSSHRNGKAKSQPQNEPGRMRPPSASLSSQEMKNSPLWGCVCAVEGSSKEVTKPKRNRSEVLHGCFPPELTGKQKNQKQNQFISHRTLKLGHVPALGRSTFLLLHPRASPRDGTCACALALLPARSPSPNR